jgi:acyl-CoA thioesterase
MTGIMLETATALRPLGQGNFRAELARNWEIWGPNGGYLAAVALRAAGQVSTIKRPAGISCQFLRTPESAAADLEATVLHAGRRSEAISVRLLQDGRLMAQALVRTAADGAGYDVQQLRPPDVPGPADAIPAPLGTAPVGAPHSDRYPFWDNVERRLLPRPAGEPICREWTRFRPHRTLTDPFLDAARALILLDTYGWPAAYAQVGDGAFIAPSLDITAWFHHPAEHATWLLIDETCTVGAQGLLGAQGHVWDEAGRLLASGGAQLCCVPRPESTKNRVRSRDLEGLR